MKISNSKKQLAKIIQENGGWRDGANFSAQDSGKDKYPGRIGFYIGRPKVRDTRWFDGGRGMVGNHEGCICNAEVLPNWHQTILSRDEYFHLYPVAETAPKPVVEAKPTIEQLAADYRNRKDYADRKQLEADAAKADAEAKLTELVSAGKAHGLMLSVAGVEPELAITDVKDLLIGDEVRCVYPNGGLVEAGSVGVVVDVRDGKFYSDFPEQRRYVYLNSHLNHGSVVFVRRPAKGGENA